MSWESEEAYQEEVDELEQKLQKAKEGIDTILNMAHNIAFNEEKEGRFLGGLTKGCYSIKEKAKQTLKDIGEK